MSTPDLRIEFDYLLSWNDFLGISRHPGAAQGMVATWRKKGHDKAIFYGERAGATVNRWVEHGLSEKGNPTRTKHETIAPVFFDVPVRLELIYWRATAARYDNFSPFVKPIVDGFVDAGLLVDDSYKYVPAFVVLAMGVDPSLKPSKEAQAARKIKRAGRKTSLPMPGRYYFDFYRLDPDAAP